MSLHTKGSAMRGAMLGLLLATTATAAFAAPKAHTPSAMEAKLAAMQQQLDEMRAQMAAMRQQPAPSAGVAELKAELDASNQKVAELTALTATHDNDIATLKSPAVTVSLPNGRPSIATSDKRFSANIKAIVMFDAGKYDQKHNLGAAVTNRDLNDGTNFRRARFGIEGKMFKDFDYNLIYEFGGSGGEDAGHIQEAWAQYTGFKPLRIRVGAFEPNVGLAAAVSTSQMPIMERPSPAEIARNIAAGDSRSAIQIQANGVFGEGDSGLAARWFASGALTGNVVGTINSTGSSAAQPFDEQQGYVGRIAIAPFDTTNWQLHFGANYQRAVQPNDAGAAATPRYAVQLRDRPELRLDGARLIDTGAIDAKNASVYGLESGASVQNFLIEGEYFKYKIERRNTPALANPHFDGWYVSGVWVLTGENRPYNPTEARFDAPKPNYNFNPSAGTFGAFEVAARYSVTNLNFREGAAGTAATASTIRGGEQKIAVLGLNWYLNPSMRMMFDVQQVKVDRLNAAGVQVGQKYNTYAIRSQFNF